jgi:hypothetical protein
MTDILDIKGLVEVGGGWEWLSWLPWLAGGIVLALLVVLIARRLFRAAGESAAPSEPTWPAHERALERFDALDPASTTAREFYFELSAALREYIEARWEFPALEMTIEELMPRLEELDVDLDRRMVVQRILAGAEPVKFAGAAAAEEQMRRDLEEARGFVEFTREVDEPLEPGLREGR